MQSQQEATEWGAMTSHTMKLCIIGAWTHIGYNLLSSIVDGTVFGKHSPEIDIYLHDRYVLHSAPVMNIVLRLYIRGLGRVVGNGHQWSN